MDKSIRIAIIGGGPAGLSAAMYLEMKGYNNYVVYEKSDHVGGKCHSPSYNGKRYEMGAIMGVPSYYAVHDIEKFANVSHEGGPVLHHSYNYPDGSVDHRWDADEASKNPMKYFFRHPKSALHLKKIAKQVKKFGEILETKYKGYDVCGHMGVAQGKYKGYAVTEDRHPVEGENPNLKDLCLPFTEFCKMNGVPLVPEIWIFPFTSFGYGYFDEIPAGYVMKYLDFQTLTNFVKGNLWTWKDGTQSIYEALNAKLQHPAVFHSDITKIVRGDKVTITVNGQEEVFDKLIITVPLQCGEVSNPNVKPLDQYLDVTDEEKELFSKIDYERYDVRAFMLEKEGYPRFSKYIVDNMVPKALGHAMIYYRRWDDPADMDQPVTTYLLRSHRYTNGGKELPYEECQKNALEDCKKIGFNIKKNEKGEPVVINNGRWYYFPHISCEDYKAGWYDKVEALQGQKNTFFAGEIMSFGDMDETCEYSHDLVERFF